MEFLKKLKNGNFEINRETLEELLKSHYMFQALQGAKVDKWEWYYDARRNYLEEAVLNLIINGLPSIPYIDFPLQILSIRF